MGTDNAHPASPPATLRISIADMVAMGVRRKKSGGRSAPSALYQELSMEAAVTLFATLPSGAFAVSLPFRSTESAGYPVLSSPPPVSDCSVIEYVRETNGRYEAQSVRSRDGVFTIAEFREIARRRIDRNEGRLEKAPGRYEIFSPSMTAWGVILRDHGYIALDPRHMPRMTPPELTAEGTSSEESRVTVRAPLLRRTGRSSELFLPAFVQVEVKTGSHDGPGAWICFDDYLALKTVKARPPGAIVGLFDEWLKQLADESGVDCWRFDPGTLFGERSEWWGDRNRRRTVHEGIDVARGMKSGANAGAIPVGTPVRPIADGDIVAVLDDFLGKTIVMRHRFITDRDGDMFHTMLSHVQVEQCRRGPVAKGLMLGRVGRAGSSSVEPHLHLTGAWIPESFADTIGMEHINPAFEPVALVDLNALVENSTLCCIIKNS